MVLGVSFIFENLGAVVCVCVFFFLPRGEGGGGLRVWGFSGLIDFRVYGAGRGKSNGR